MKRPTSCVRAILAMSILLISCSPTEPEKPELRTEPTDPAIPELRVEPTSLSFNKSSDSGTLVLSKTGSGELTWEIADKPDWLEVSEDSGRVTTGEDTVIVTADIAQEAGQYSGAINIASNDGTIDVSASLDISVWVQMSSMPTARTGHAVGTVNGKIYAVGGEQSKSTVLEEYDPATDTWTTKTDMPTNRGWLSASVINGKIYVMGGYNPALSDSTAPTVEVYDPVADTWKAGSPMPVARWGHCAGTVDGKIYVVGGALDWPVDAMHGAVDEYDPMTDTWTTKSSIPSARWALSCSVINGKIYAIGGGNDENAIVPTVEEYDPATDTWTEKSSMPTARWGLSTAVVNGKIYAIGGGDVYPPKERLTTVEEYDPVADTWTTKSPMPVGRIGHASSSASIDMKIYLVGGGGLTPSDAYAEVYEYEPGLDISHE